jgi:hypothetical protein
MRPTEARRRDWDPQQLLSAIRCLDPFVGSVILVSLAADRLAILGLELQVNP